MKTRFWKCTAFTVLALGFAPLGELIASSASAQTRCNCNKGKQACVRCCEQNNYAIGCKWGCDSCSEPPKKRGSSFPHTHWPKS